MGGPPRPKPPDPMQTARAQQGLNRDSVRDAAAFSQIGQQTPWGSVSYTGELGSPDRQQHVSLNPQDQARLDQQRGIQSGLLGMILGGGGQGQGSMAQGGGRGKAGQAQQMPPMRMQKAVAAVGKMPKPSRPRPKMNYESDNMEDY